MSNSNKFLFDLNNFDAPEEIEEEIVEEEVYVEPPPPSFSEDDLEAAKAVAHSKGHSEGIIEERERREQFIAENLQEITNSFETLFAAELYREKQYEEESVQLALEIINILAPSLNDRLGEEALKQSLKQVLKSQSEQSEIRIEVHPDTTNDLSELIDSIWPDKDSAPRYKVVANNEIKIGACALSWKDGGMVRDPEKTANDIKTKIEELLVEQVMFNDSSMLTPTQNNAINNKESADSAPEIKNTSEDEAEQTPLTPERGTGEDHE